MNQMPQLRGMTWNHPRGIDPLIAASEQWLERTGIAVTWEARSLQDFESYPVEVLARTYDLIVIDHPHVGQITRERCLAPLDLAERVGEVRALKKHSVGASFDSYVFDERLWALPIDAATQVQAYRPDRLPHPATEWSEVMRLATGGFVHCPLRPPHSLMTLYTLCGLLGRSGAVLGPDLIDPAVGAMAFDHLRELVAHLDARCFEMDPIATLDAMSQADSRIQCVPFIYGYVSYAHAGFRPARVAFADMPVLKPPGRPVGSALGGTGIAVSAFCEHRAAAIDFAYWVAGAECQSGIYAAGGGQPGHGLAWESNAVNEPAFGFYRNTRATLEGAWVRPRHDGYMAFQASAAQMINDALRSGRASAAAIADINRLFRKSLPPSPSHSFETRMRTGPSRPAGSNGSEADGNHG